MVCEVVTQLSALLLLQDLSVYGIGNVEDFNGMLEGMPTYT
jgi:hypothetical protein